ncbi:MAG TPA: MBL fold metallo-hydrolase [Longimicrobiales bacterium]|nr:MBL fold metallo-hydrolase [Longimicrobiales bacterium]
MRNRIVILSSLLCLAAVPTYPQERHAGVTVTFLANEGVLLTAGGRKVLIDALFEKYKTGFALPADSTRSALAGARAPFNDVDAVLFTHYHGDHFHPAPVAAHMRANARATLLTSQQVIDSLHGRLSAGEPIANRFRARSMAPGAKRREIVNGIRIDVLGLPHGGRPDVQHLGFIVELGGRRVLHLGDADFNAQTFAALRLDTMRIDVALVPEWALLDGQSRQIVQRWIRPRQIVAIHVMEGQQERVARAVRRVLPSATTFTRSLETRTW